MKGLGTVGKIFKRSAEREAIRTVKDGIWHGIRRKAEQGLRGPKKNNSSRRRSNNQRNIELIQMNNKSGTNNSRRNNNNIGLVAQNTGLSTNNIEIINRNNSAHIKGGSRKKSKKSNS